MALNITLLQGKTFSRVIRWESLPFIYKPITAITQAAPAAIASAAHGIPDGWRVAVVSVQGMDEINAVNKPPKAAEFIKATVVDAGNVTLNSVNSSDFHAYRSGGYLQFYTPVDLVGYTARMQIKDKFGGTVLATLASPADIVIDNATKTITVTISATATEGYTWTKGVYDLEMVSPGGVVTAILSGTIVVMPEVTT